MSHQLTFADTRCITITDSFRINTITEKRQQKSKICLATCTNLINHDKINHPHKKWEPLDSHFFIDGNYCFLVIKTFYHY